MHKIKRSTIVIIAILALLAIGTAVFALLNRRNTRAGDGASFVIVCGEVEHTVTKDELAAIGLRGVEANYKKNGKPAETRVYTGVPLVEILAHKSIDTQGISTAHFAASDGFRTVLSIDDALDSENCFIVLDDDAGPFLMIKPKDPFSQYWCKYLTEITLK